MRNPVRLLGGIFTSTSRLHDLRSRSDVKPHDLLAVAASDPTSYRGIRQIASYIRSVG